MMPRNVNALLELVQGQWDKTSQPLQERASILPLGQYHDGSVGLAWPGILAAPAEGMVNFGRYGYDTPEAIRDNALSAFDVAGGAMTGGLGVGLAGGLVDNAVGSAGAKLTENALERAQPQGMRPGLALAEAGRNRFDITMDGDTIGNVYMREQPQTIQIGNFKIDPDFQRQGIGTEVQQELARMYGKPNVPDSSLSAAEYARWMKNDPAAVADYALPAPDANFYTPTYGTPGYYASMGAGPAPGTRAASGELFSNAPTGAAVPLALNALERAGVDAPQGIRAYHGSPHDFDRFDLSKIGTGEGAQAYGHGLYFAEAEDVARGYREKLGMGNSPSNYAAMDQAKEALEFAKGDKQAALKRIDDIFADSPRDRRHAELSKQYVMEPPGRMYEVNIRANPEDFLDFDAPISAQPAIRDRLAPLGLPDDAKGHGLYNALVDRLLADGRLEPGTDLSVQVSRALRDAGIPGVKYLDGMSRQAGEGSRNYVVTDDAIIDILRKYANAPTGSIVPLGMEAQDDPALIEVLRRYSLIQ